MLLTSRSCTRTHKNRIMIQIVLESRHKLLLLLPEEKKQTDRKNHVDNDEDTLAALSVHHPHGSQQQQQQHPTATASLNQTTFTAARHTPCRQVLLLTVVVLHLQDPF